MDDHQRNLMESDEKSLIFCSIVHAANNNEVNILLSNYTFKRLIAMIKSGVLAS